MDKQTEGPPQYIHINQNDFSYRKHKKQKEEDIAICECKYDANNPDSACGERCLNLLTSTECTPGYCPCCFYCKNQRFQKCEYAKTKLFRTEGRGWGLLADENIKAGQFIIEYCGEVISWKEARRRSQTYETQGLKDAYIISLNTHESIDASKKGSLARFINHSCQPNCETRKWTVLGEIRVGIFAKQDISVGTELAYDYNFEWYGGAKVRCLCGAASCPGFLGAKSRGFQEDTYLWEDDDDRYSVEKIPLYDSAEDEPSSKLLKIMDSSNPESITNWRNEYCTMMDVTVGSEHQFEATALVVKALDSVPVEGVVVNAIQTEVGEERKLYSQDTQQAFSQTNAMISRIRSNSACRNYQIGPGPVPKKRSQPFSNGRSKFLAQKQVDTKLVTQLLASKEAQDEVFKYEDMKNHATTQLNSLYNEIRPAIEEHERDTQDSVPTSVAEKWIEASCLKLKAEFDLYSSIIKNVACTPRRAAWGQAKPSEGGDNENELDTSTKCSKVGSECVMDYTTEFTTHEIFRSREALCKWCREVGKRNGFVVVIKSSDAGCSGRKARVMLVCERSGHYRKLSKDGSTSKKRPKRDTGTKKCGCPFALKGQKLDTNDDWMLKVVRGVHNHSAAQHLEGHSYAGRLSSEETSLLVDMSASLVRPKEILVTLKQRDALNATTLKTIYNARHRSKVLEKAGRSQMQQLLGKLAEHKYIEWHRSCNNTETVTDLFYAHPCSIDLLRAFPRILIMDCTYKTNRYRFPLLEIVGMTSTDMTFSVAFAYIDSEREDNYTWALGRLRSLMDDVLPEVIVTDRELALMNAIQRVFPTARHLLCRWHISRNVMANCKMMFETKEKWDKFIMSWNILVLSSTEEEYNEHFAALNREFSTYPEALRYVTTSWLNTYKDRFVAAWIDTCMHNGNTTTNMAESAHAKLKKHLGSSQGSFESSWIIIHNLIELQHTDIKASFEKSLTVVQHNFKPNDFKELRGFISISALNRVLTQLKRANSVGIDAVACGCVIRQTHGLPCAHKIAEYKRKGRPIPLECIHTHWRKLDMVPAPLNEVVELSCQAEFKLISKRFNEHDTF